MEGFKIHQNKTRVVVISLNDLEVKSVKNVLKDKNSENDITMQMPSDGDSR